MLKNTSSQTITLVAYDSATGKKKTGDSANITFYVNKDNGGVTVLGTSTPTEDSSTNSPGTYTSALTQAETNADKLVFSGKSSTSGIEVVPQTIYTFPTGGIASPTNITAGTITTATNLTNAGPDTAGTTTLLARIPTFPANFATLVIDGTGRVNAFLVGILTSVFTEGAVGRIAAAFKQFLNVATPTLTTAGTDQTGDSFARIGAAGAGLTAIGDTRIANLDATVSSRLAPAGTLARVTLTDTVTTLTNLPAIPANWLTAAGISAAALNGKGDWSTLRNVASEANHTAGTVWHISPTGNDANSGLSWDAPKQHMTSLSVGEGDVILLSAGTHVLTSTFHPAAGVTIRGMGRGATFLTDTNSGTYTGDAASLLLLDSGATHVLEDFSASIGGAVAPNNNTAIYLVAPGGSVNLAIRRCHLTTAGQDLISGIGSLLWISDSELVAPLASDSDVIVFATGSIFVVRASIVAAQCTNISGPLYMLDCDLSGVVGIHAGGSNLTLNVVNTRIRVKVGDTSAKAFDVAGLTGSTVVAYGCDFDRSLVVGTVIDLPPLNDKATAAAQTSQGATLGTIATQTTAANIAAAVWNALVASYQSVTGSFGKLIQTLSGGTTINVTGSPINVTVAIPSGQPARQDLVMVQGEAKTWVFTLKDLAGNPIDETGKTLKFVIEDLTGAYVTEVVSPNIAIVVNVISVTVPATVSVNAANLVYHLWNTTDKIVRVEGSLEIPAAAQPV